MTWCEPAVNTGLLVLWFFLFPVMYLKMILAVMMTACYSLLFHSQKPNRFLTAIVKGAWQEYESRESKSKNWEGHTERCLAHYKSPEFDVKKKLRIQFKGQPPVDTGGVTREFYTKLFQVIDKMFFQGGKYKSPVYGADIVASGLMRYFGTVIVHSILQGGPGFPALSPSVYCYTASGNIDAAMAKMNYGDC